MDYSSGEESYIAGWDKTKANTKSSLWIIFNHVISYQKVEPLWAIKIFEDP